MSISPATDALVFGFRVTSPLGFKATVGSLIRTLAEAHVRSSRRPQRCAMRCGN